LFCGYLLRIKFPPFWAKCPEPLVLRGAPGHALEESLLDVNLGSNSSRH
jgi:hypothetical protein